MKKSRDVFHVWFLSFDDGTDPVHKFVANVVDDEHLVLSFLDLSEEVFPNVRVVVDGRQCAHMEMFLERSVGHWVYPGLSGYGRSGSIFEGNDPTITGELSRVVVTGKEVGEDGQVERGDLPDPGDGGDQSDRFVEPVIGEHEFFYLRLYALYFAVECPVDLFEVVLGELSQGGTEELQFVGIFIDIGTGVDEFSSDLEHDLDLFQDFGHGYVKLHFPMVLGGVNGDAFGIDPIVLSPLYADAPEYLYGHLDTEVGLFLDQFGYDQPAVYSGMFEAHKRVVHADLLVSEQSYEGPRSLFGVLEHIRGSPVILDDGHVEEPFRYVDTDKAREVFSFHDIGF